MFITSVGAEAINNLGIVFTKFSLDDEVTTMVKEKAMMVTQVFKDMKIDNVPAVLPFWFIENHLDTTCHTMTTVLIPEV